MKMLPVTIYADTTDQYTEEEIEEMQGVFGQMIEIEVPEDLLFQWWLEIQSTGGRWFAGDTLLPQTKEGFLRWVYEESVADDADTLFDWLVAHGFHWKRSDK